MVNLQVSPYPQTVNIKSNVFTSCIHSTHYLSSGLVSDAKEVASVTFLVTVNDRWYPQEYNTTCLQTVKTTPLRPDVSINKTQSIQVGNCDRGPLTYTIDNEYFTGNLKLNRSLKLLYLRQLRKVTSPNLGDNDL